MNSVPRYNGPASIAFLTLLAGLALMYWALVGFGVISGNTPTERYQKLKGSIRKDAP